MVEELRWRSCITRSGGILKLLDGWNHPREWQMDPDNWTNREETVKLNGTHPVIHQYFMVETLVFLELENISDTCGISITVSCVGNPLYYIHDLYVWLSLVPSAWHVVESKPPTTAKTNHGDAKSMITIFTESEYDSRKIAGRVFILPPFSILGELRIELTSARPVSIKVIREKAVYKEPFVSRILYDRCVTIAPSSAEWIFYNCDSKFKWSWTTLYFHTPNYDRSVDRVRIQVPAVGLDVEIDAVDCNFMIKAEHVVKELLPKVLMMLIIDYLTEPIDAGRTIYRIDLDPTRNPGDWPTETFDSSRVREMSIAVRASQPVTFGTLANNFLQSNGGCTCLRYPT